MIFWVFFIILRKWVTKNLFVSSIAKQVTILIKILYPNFEFETWIEWKESSKNPATKKTLQSLVGEK